MFLQNDNLIYGDGLQSDTVDTTSFTIRVSPIQKTNQYAIHKLTVFCREDNLVRCAS